MKEELSTTNTYDVSTLTENDIVLTHINSLCNLNVSINPTHQKIPTMYWIPKLHKQPYKQRFISNSVSCSTTKLSTLLTSCLTVVKENTIKYADKVFETSNKNIFWSIKNSNEVLKKLETLNNQASSISSYDFSTLYTSLPHNLIKSKLVNLIKKTFLSLKCDFIACNENKAFFTNGVFHNYTMWTSKMFCEALEFLIDNIFVRFGNNVYIQKTGKFLWEQIVHL